MKTSFSNMMFNKKGILPLLLSPIILIILGVLILLIILATLGFAFFLTSNIFLLIGAFLIVIGGVGLLMRFAFQIGITLIIMGIALLILPNLFEGLTGITLATFMP